MNIREQFLRWQNCGYVHPLTCGIDSCREDLVLGEETNSNLIIKCPKCDYVQIIEENSNLWNILMSFKSWEEHLK